MSSKWYDELTIQIHTCIYTAQKSIIQIIQKSFIKRGINSKCLIIIHYHDQWNDIVMCIYVGYMDKQYI